MMSALIILFYFDLGIVNGRQGVVKRSPRHIVDPQAISSGFSLLVIYRNTVEVKVIAEGATFYRHQFHLCVCNAETKT